MNNKIYIMNANDNDDNAGRSPALYTCGKYGAGHAACPYFEDARTRCQGDCQSVGKNVVENVVQGVCQNMGIHQGAGDIEAPYSSKGIPPLHQLDINLLYQHHSYSDYKH